MAAKTKPRKRVECDAYCFLHHVRVFLNRGDLLHAGRALLEANRRLLFAHCQYHREFPKHASDLRAMVRTLKKCGGFENAWLPQMLYGIIQTGEACLRGEGDAKHVEVALVFTDKLCNGSKKELRFVNRPRGSSAAAEYLVQPKAGGQV